MVIKRAAPIVLQELYELAKVSHSSRARKVSAQALAAKLGINQIDVFRCFYYLKDKNLIDSDLSYNKNQEILLDIRVTAFGIDMVEDGI